MTYRTALVLLQNAYHKQHHWVASGWPTPRPLPAGFSVWPRSDWLRAFHACQSGVRWKAILEPQIPGIWWHFDNANPLVAAHADGLHPPDRKYVKALLEGRTRMGVVPDLVVACGRQAGHVAEELWPGKLLVMPHPASRVLTNDLMLRARDLIATGDFDRLRLAQLRGSVDEVPLPPTKAAGDKPPRRRHYLAAATQRPGAIDEPGENDDQRLRLSGRAAYSRLRPE